MCSVNMNNLRNTTSIPNFNIRAASAEDVALILSFIRELAEYEKLSHEVVSTEESLRTTLFGARPAAEVLIGELAGQPIAFALYFHNYSTFLGKPGLYLEDLYVKPPCRGKGFGKALLRYLAKIACDRGCGRFEWSVLNWNEPAIEFYKKIGAVAMSEWTVQRLTGNALIKLAQES